MKKIISALALTTLLFTVACAQKRKVSKTKPTNTTSTSTSTSNTPGTTPVPVTGGKKMNVLFIAVDDLKPYIGAYGDKFAVTPNLDALAKTSTVYTNAHTQQAVCGPSRASLLTGVRPDKTKVWDLQTEIRSINPNIVMLPQFFRNNGYETIGMGKIFDPRSVDKSSDEASWSTPFVKKYKLAAGYEDLAFETYQSPDIIAKAKAGVKMGGGDDAKSDVKVSTENMDVPDDAYNDGAMTNYAITKLSSLKGTDKPFFMAVGFKKPHLPFVAPKKYWNMYDRSKIMLETWQKKSENAVELAYHNSGEIRSYNDIKPVDPNAKKNAQLELPEDKQRELLHGYYACISYIDAQVGKLMASLKANGLDKNTVIVLWGDHGWHFGDHSLWAKHSNFEQATHVPMIFNVPGVTKGFKNTNPAEFVDIYPTLANINGLAIPAHLDGKSLLPVMNDNSKKVKDFAISQYPRGAGKGAREFMGYSLRNNQYRFTEWVGNHFTTAKAFSEADVQGIELYDLLADPKETKNIANDPKMKKVVDELKTQLHNYYTQQLATAGIVQ